MKTIKTIKEFEKYFNKENDWYEFKNDNYEIEIEINTQKSLYFEYSVYFKKSIKAVGTIDAVGYIEAGGYIDTVGYIEAGGYIDTVGYIKAGGYIEAGGYIKAGGYILSLSFTIICKKMITRTLPFWRDYYKDIPILKKWKKEIETLCWDDLRNLPTEKEKKTICAWNGWHWIIRAQLEMFFGLKKEYIVEDKINEKV